jgi:ribosome-associated protein
VAPHLLKAKQLILTLTGITRMTKTAKRKTFTPLVDEIIEGLEDIKGENIVVLDLRKLENSICDFFVIGEGTSNTQVNALCNAVEKRVRENLNEKPWHTEGSSNAEWVLLDYVNVAVHVFQKSVREFYDLESLWGDAKITKI